MVSDAYSQHCISHHDPEMTAFLKGSTTTQHRVIQVNTEATVDDVHLCFMCSRSTSFVFLWGNTCNFCVWMQSLRLEVDFSS